MSSIKYIASFVLIAISVQGCAQRATAIAPAVVPTANYDGYQCGELKSMLKLKTSQKISLEKRQNSAATWDAISVFFTLFPLATVFGMDRQGEVAQVKGESMALQGAVQRQCRKSD